MRNALTQTLYIQLAQFAECGKIWVTMERRHAMNDGIILHDEETLLFHVWDEYVTEMEYEQDRGGEPAVETEASSIWDGKPVYFNYLD